MKSDARSFGPLTFVVPSALGLLITAIDRAAPFGDDSSQFTVFLWLASSGLLGFVRPARPWLWAVLLGPWLPLGYLVMHVLGFPDSFQPSTYATLLSLLALSLTICSAGAYGGALLRKLGSPRVSNGDYPAAVE